MGHHTLRGVFSMTCKQIGFVLVSPLRLLFCCLQSVKVFIVCSNLTTSCVYVNVGYCMKTCQLMMKCFNLSSFWGDSNLKDKMLRSTKEIVMHIYLWFLQYRETFVFTCCGAQGQGKEIIYWYIYICNTVKNSWAILDFFIFCWRNQGWFGAIAPQAVEKSFKDFLWTLAAFPIICSPAFVPEQCQMIYSVCLFDHKL